jgi:hypothetical protein
LKLKERILAQKEFNLSKNVNITLDLKSTVSLPNGGIMSVNLYKVADSYYYFNDSSNANNDSTTDKDYQIISSWLEPRGETLVIQKPSNTLDVQITTEKSTYSPGDQVNYEVTIRDRKTQRVVSDRDVIVSLTATDESVFT